MPQFRRLNSQGPHKYLEMTVTMDCAVYLICIPVAVIFSTYSVKTVSKLKATLENAKGIISFEKEYVIAFAVILDFY